jgi:hypothetical protein
MKRIALIKNGTVVNVVVAESLEKMPRVEGCECVEIDGNRPVSFEWRWNGQTFTAPTTVEREPSPPSLDERVTALEKQIADLQKGK